jgi:cytochrome c-type biogenesis protein CcmH
MFWLISIVMTLVACGCVWWPLMRSHKQQSILLSRKQTNVALFKTHVDELDAALALHEISPENYTQQKYELETALLSEAHGDDQPILKQGKRSLFLLALLIPVVAFLLYHQLGALNDVTLTQLLARAGSAVTPIERSDALNEALVKLELKAQKQPKNTDNLFLLGQLYVQKGDYQRAVNTFGRSLSINAMDADVLAQYSQALYFAAGNKLTFAVTTAAEQALNINPQQATALGMLGIAAFENKKYHEAIKYWQQVLAVVGEQDSGAQALKAGINHAIELLKQQGNWSAITVHVDIDKTLVDARNPAQRIFVYARKVGERKPLAITVIEVATLPMEVTLDDSNSMPGGELLSSVKSVEIVARLSQTGIAAEVVGDKQVIKTINTQSKIIPNLYIQ